MDIMEEDWDYLIILDACRYDYFREAHEKYLDGDLKKFVSPATGTKEWCEKVFQSKYEDVVYVSANPHINSRGVGDIDVNGIFHKIIDVWDWGWDESKKTVPPSEVNREVLDAINDYPEKRFVVHYMQPHAPYLSLETVGDFSGGASPTDWKSKGKKDSSLRSSLLELKGVGKKCAKKIIRRVIGYTGHRKAWKVMKIFGIQPDSLIYKVLQRKGEKDLRNAYKENLNIVLEQVSHLLDNISGKAVVTSDHGELLGERGCYGHDLEIRVPALVEVPWFETNVTEDVKG